METNSGKQDAPVATEDEQRSPKKPPTALPVKRVQTLWKMQWKAIWMQGGSCFPEDDLREMLASGQKTIDAAIAEISDRIASVKMVHNGTDPRKVRSKIRPMEERQQLIQRQWADSVEAIRRAFQKRYGVGDDASSSNVAQAKRPDPAIEEGGAK